MGINISDLPTAMQKQAMEKYSAQISQTANKSKYHNEPVTEQNIKFSSKKEAKRYRELMQELKIGSIKELKLQHSFTLQEAYTTPSGERIRAIRYDADFTYFENGRFIVEDVKSAPTRTRVYLLKKKLMQERLGITIKET
ncbi:MAG TPA: hypothetical protein DIT32_03535 [Peptococcaceae bacterium]|nr:hypothetical protein [Peptococcaceae bacterium]